MAANAFVILTLAFHREGKNWVAECVELGTSTYDRSFPRAHDELIELVTLHLNALEDAGQRQSFFEEHGIKLYTDHGPEEVQRTIRVNDERFVEAHRIPVGTSA